VPVLVGVEVRAPHSAPQLHVLPVVEELHRPPRWCFCCGGGPAEAADTADGGEGEGEGEGVGLLGASCCTGEFVAAVTVRELGAEAGRTGEFQGDGLCPLVESHATAAALLHCMCQ
jgi:hypothetical protein